MAIPPSSAKAIASLIWRRSKYFSRIATDRTISAELARPLRVLRPQAKVLLADPRRGGEHVGFDGGVVGGDLMLLPAPHVEQDQPWITASGQQATARRQTIDPQLQRVGRQQRGVERGVGFEVDQGHPAIDLADAVDDSAHTRAADRHVEPGLD